MFTGKDDFKNTQKNRAAIAERYGDELNNLLNNQPSTQGQQNQTAPAKVESNISQPDNALQRNGLIRTAGRNYLEQLHSEGDTANAETAFRLQSALNKNNTAEIENILKQNNVPIPEAKPAQQTQPSQPQQDPVTQNKPPENILPKKQQQLINRASAQVKTGTKGKKPRQRQGNAIIELAGQTGEACSIPPPHKVNPILRRLQKTAALKQKTPMEQLSSFHKA